MDPLITPFEPGNRHCAVPSSLSRSAVAVVAGRDPAPPLGTTSKKDTRDLKLQRAILFLYELIVKFIDFYLNLSIQSGSYFFFVNNAYSDI